MKRQTFARHEVDDGPRRSSEFDQPPAVDDDATARLQDRAPEFRPVGPSPYAGLARALRACVVLALVLIAATLAARATALACAMSLPPGMSKQDAGVVGVVEAAAGILWSVGSSCIGPMAGALVALGLGAMQVIAAGRSPKAAATVCGMAVGAAAVCGSQDLVAAIDAARASLVTIALLLVGAGACIGLAARWTEELALAAALASRTDPLAIDRAVEHEAEVIAIEGAELADRASRRLAGVLRGHDDSMAVRHPIRRMPADGFEGPMSGSPIPPIRPGADG